MYVLNLQNWCDFYWKINDFALEWHFYFYVFSHLGWLINDFVVYHVKVGWWWYGYNWLILIIWYVDELLKYLFISA